MEKPILFSTAMVQAILAGRKTQTRRVIKPQPPHVIYAPGYPKKIDDKRWYFARENKSSTWNGMVVIERGQPYQPGDTLWVRETWADLRGMGFDESFAYLANSLNRSGEEDAESKRARLDYGVKWKPSIHMPRKAARLFLKVKNIRVERIKEILMNDMLAEGCIPPGVTGGQWQQWQRDYWIPLWDSINSGRGYGWEVNPWVWVIEFERTSL